MASLSFFRSFYPTRIVFFTGYSAATLFVLSYFIPLFYKLAAILLVLLLVAVLIDAFLLYAKRTGIVVERDVPERLSNGDANGVQLRIRNRYPFATRCLLIEELPVQFQQRNWKEYLKIDRGVTELFQYPIVPVTRGLYQFGVTNVFATGPLNVVQRRYRSAQPVTVPVYPSYIQMRHYQLAAIGNQLQDAGSKRLRKLGHSLEFEQIKEYVRGDDYRTVNWKATARRGDLMVNAYTDERSQQIYCIINKGRVMRMPFDGLTLLDHSINAALALLNIALRKGDKAGLVTYAEKVDAFVPAEKKGLQLNVLLEELYNAETTFSEPDNEALFASIRNCVSQRSLLILFTNFESSESLDRQLPFLKKLARYHLLVVVFFENTELKTLLQADVKTTEDIYIKTIAEKYQQEKRLMVKELHKQGIIALLTPPQQLTANAINKYLELKKRQSL